MDVDSSPSMSSPATPSTATAHTPPEPTSPATPPSQSPSNNAQPVSPNSLSIINSSTAFSSKIIRNLIVSYLIHNCYEKTAIAFLSADENSAVSDGFIMETTKPQLKQVNHSEPLNDYHLATRRKLMTSVADGDIQPALSLADGLLQSHSVPSTMNTSFPETYARALCQHYVELIRANEDLSALAFARGTIRSFSKQFNDALVLLKRYLPLLAYQQPELSPMFDLVDVNRRDALADELNGCVLAWLRADTCALCTLPPLERILRQLTLIKRKLEKQQWNLNDIWDEDTKMGL